MANIGTWEEDANKALRLATDCLALAKERDRRKRLRIDYSRQTTQLRQHLATLQTTRVDLDKRLSAAEQQNQLIGEDELTRKEQKLVQLSRQINMIESKLEQDENASRPSNDASALTSFAPHAAEASLHSDQEEVNQLDNNGLLQLHQRMMDSQDAQLDQLSDVIGKQREMGLLISNELDRHVELLQHAEDSTEATNQRLANARRRLDKISRQLNDRRSVCIMAALIIIVIILIIYVKT